jgi:hypothetical protein
MCVEIENKLNEPDPNMEKIMRWVVFIQGILWGLGEYTIDDLKEHNR